VAQILSFKLQDSSQSNHYRNCTGWNRRRFKECQC